MPRKNKIVDEEDLIWGYEPSTIHESENSASNGLEKSWVSDFIVSIEQLKKQSQRKIDVDEHALRREIANDRHLQAELRALYEAYGTDDTLVDSYVAQLSFIIKS